MFMPRRKRLALSLGVLAILGSAGAARGVLIGFDCITWNNASNAAIGRQQLWMDVTSPRHDQAAFTFYNIGSHRSTIAQIYFEDGPLALLLSIASSSGVTFTEGGSPKSLPGGNALNPAFETASRVAAAKPTPHNGVKNTPMTGNEWVTLVFALDEGKSYTDVLQDLAASQLRVGLHVQDFANGGSETFVNTPVPEPATLAFGAVAALGVGMIRSPRRVVLEQQ